MAPRPPSDAVVALRSLRRRYRGLFAGISEDESPDDLARRSGSDGRSARDHVVAATDAVVAGASAVDGALGGPSGALDGPGGAPGPASRGATVGDDIEQLADRADALAARVEHVPAQEWADTNALDSLWQAVDSAVEHLREAERTLREVRGRPQ